MADSSCKGSFFLQPEVEKLVILQTSKFGSDLDFLQNILYTDEWRGIVRKILSRCTLPDPAWMSKRGLSGLNKNEHSWYFWHDMKFVFLDKC